MDKKHETEAFPWYKIEDKTFEELVRGLAKQAISHIDWDLYLKNGYKQEGIDIYGFDTSSSKHACIQCKFYKEIDISLLGKWITDFEDGKFYATANKFIIATRADSQTKAIRDFFDTQVIRLNEHSIELKLWDSKNLEEKLREEYGLVSHYFGLSVANDHCYSKNRHPIAKYPRIKNFIDRKVIKIEDVDNPNQFRFYFDKSSKIDFNSIFLTDYVTTRRICLIADAYQGKSTILEQLAGVLSDSDDYIPLLVRIKAHTLKPLSETLDESYSYWKQYPTRELVIILDGLDEVARDKFVEYSKLIIEFTNSYPSINVVFSCRKLFCSHYRIYDKATSFDFYEICPITEQQTEAYINKLGRRKKQFKAYIEENKLHELIYHPFYLTRLVDVYSNSVNSLGLPKSKFEILNFLIAESFKPVRQRILVGGNTLEEERENYISCIKKIALASQMIGVNSLSIDEVSSLFNEKERGLLMSSSFLSVTNSQWTFEITFFQENLAAMALIEMPYDNILKVTTVGSIHRKIRMKWIQTIASFISLLDLRDERRASFLKLIENDNVELLTFCDATKFDVSFRLDVLNKIIAKCIKTNSFPQPSSVDIIANFIKESKEAIPLLLTIAERETSLLIKILCWKIIFNLLSLNGNEAVVKASAHEILFNTNNGQLAGLMVNVLSKFNLVAPEEVQAITKTEAVKRNVDFLNALFEMLISMNIVDEYYFIAVDSIEIFEKNQLKHSLYGGQTTLERILFCATTSKNIYSFLLHISIKKWTPIFGDSYLNDDTNHLLSKLCDLAVKGYELEPLVFFPVSSILKYYLQRHDQTKYNLLKVFLEKTNTGWLFFRLCKEEFPYHNLSQLAYIITQDCFEYIVSEYEEERISQHTLEEWYFWIKYWKIDDKLAAEYYDKIVAVTKSQFREIQEAKNIENRELETKREENDLIIIQTPEAFEEGLKVFFQVYGNASIPRGETFLGYSQNVERRKVDSVFFSNFFLYFNTDEISLHQCFDLMSNRAWFKYFQAKQILIYNFPNEDAKRILLSILENYFVTAISSADFTNSYKQDGNRISWNKSHELLKNIYEKYRFDVDDEHLVKLIWVIKDGFNHLKSSAYRNNESNLLSKVLIEKIDPDLLIETIITNITIGISTDSVLSSHLEFCRYLKVHEIVYLILKPQIFNRFSSNQQRHLVEIFCELGGEKQELLTLFNNLNKRYNENSDVILELATVLMEEYRDSISRSLEHFLNDNAVEDRTKLEFAKKLINAGNLFGYTFLVNHVANNASALDRIHHFYSLDNIPTEFAICELAKIKQHILDDDLSFHQREIYSVKEFLLHNLYSFAKRSEGDLILVEQYLIGVFDEFSAHANSKFILSHIERIFEAFRDSNQLDFTVVDVKGLFSKN